MKRWYIIQAVSEQTRTLYLTGHKTTCIVVKNEPELQGKKKGDMIYIDLERICRQRQKKRDQAS